jgi:uncharacterized protein YegP (UPF0339 family)
MMSPIRFEKFERRGFLGLRFYFRIVVEGNNETIAPSQPYKTERARDLAIGTIKAGAAGARTIEGKRK